MRKRVEVIKVKELENKKVKGENWGKIPIDSG